MILYDAIFSDSKFTIFIRFGVLAACEKKFEISVVVSRLGTVTVGEARELWTIFSKETLRLRVWRFEKHPSLGIRNV